MLLVAFLLVNAPNCHLSLVLASAVQGDAVNCNTCAAVSLSGTHLNLPRVRFKRCGGSKQTVLREKLAHKAKICASQDFALNKTREQTKGGSRPCEHCALCGCYGKNNKFMVPNVSQLLTKTKTFKLNQSLTCANFGIYVATCVICHEQYFGQTSNKFSNRWSAHRSNWNKQDCKTDSDKNQMALSRHYSDNHGTINKPPLHEAYTVTFVEQPSCHSLDICENK